MTNFIGRFLFAFFLYSDVDQISAKTGQSQAQNQVFYHLLKFGSLVFSKLHRMIAWNKVQLLVEIKCTKTFLRANFAQMGQYRARKQGLTFFQVWFINSPGNCIRYNLEHCLTSSRGKTHERSFEGPKLGQGCISRLHYQFPLILHRTAACDNL